MTLGTWSLRLLMTTKDKLLVLTLIKESPVKEIAFTLICLLILQMLQNKMEMSGKLTFQVLKIKKILVRFQQQLKYQNHSDSHLTSNLSSLTTVLLFPKNSLKHQESL